MRDLFTQETYLDIFSYINIYEITEVLLAIPDWDSRLSTLLPIFQQDDPIKQDVETCQCHKITSPLMGQMIHIIESSRYELFVFYQKVFKQNRFDEFIFSWIILFANDSFFRIYWEKHIQFTHHLWRHCSHSSHVIYGLEMISFKMRNRLPIHDFYQILHQIDQYCHGNQDIMYLYKNYHRVHRKNPLSLRYFQDIKQQYNYWILQNPSFLFLYIESYQEEDEL